MTEKPDYVKAFTKPPKTEIKHIGKGWYLYECTSRYDPELKRSRKVSGQCLGAITPTGLVQSQRRMQRVDTPRPTVPNDVLQKLGATVTDEELAAILAASS